MSDHGPVGPGALTSTGVFSCVVDHHPRFHTEALRWFASLVDLAGVRPHDLVVHTVGTQSSDALSYLEGQGVALHVIDPFDPRSPHCNKIAGALRLADEPPTGLVVLCDTDIAVLEDPRQVSVPFDSVAAKLVDAALPPLDVLIAVFRSAGLPVPDTSPLPWGQVERTVVSNFNGGLYLIPGTFLPTIAPAWATWAHWLLDRTDLLGSWSVHVDQVALSLALASEQVEPVALDTRWNTPTHDLSRMPPDASSPSVIHYHQRVDDQERVLATGIRSVDRQVRKVNAAYADHADAVVAGPGVVVHASKVASRNEALVLDTVLEAVQPTSLLDVGPSGMSSGASVDHVTIIERTADALHEAQSRNPESEASLGPLEEHPVHADLTICTHLADRQVDGAAYRDFVRSLWSSAERCLVVTGYERPPDPLSPVHPFHEPLSVTLGREAPDAEVYPVQVRGPLTTFVVLRPPVARHPRDFTNATLAPLVGRHPDLLDLVALRAHAWGTLEFYPDHAPRLWEYPVVSRLIHEQLPRGSTLVDVGAGVTPLAPFLTGRGYVVDTVDPSPIRRTWPPQPDWNEWDYLDYAKAGLAHRSWNTTLGRVPRRNQFDCAYSISVIEHVPAKDRRAMLADIADRVRTGGLVALTIDIERGTDALWNRSRGLQVEDPSLHGSYRDIITEAAHVGLELFETEIVRDWGESDVDIGYYAFRKLTRPPTSRHRKAARALLSKVRAATASPTLPPATLE